MKKLFSSLFLLNLLLWHNSGFSQTGFLTPINLTEQDGNTLTNHAVRLTINTQALVSQGKMNANGSDMRFYEDSCTGAQLSHWLEDAMNTDTTKIWVLVPSITSSATTRIYLGYGDSAATDVSSFSSVFPNAVISGGSNVILSGTPLIDWLQIDAGDTLFVTDGSTLTILARKIQINGYVDGKGAGNPGGLISQIGSGLGGGTNSTNSGSGGGSYGGVGGTGGFDPGDSPGIGGPVYGTNTGTDFDMGSGGGASDLSFGGAGGGGILLDAQYISINGTINVDGTEGQQPGSGRGGGGGSGGSLVAIASTLIFTGTISAKGAQGSIGTSTANDDGGGGGGGRVKLFYSQSLINTGSISVTGGPAGLNGTAAPGAAGADGVLHVEQISSADLLINPGTEVNLDFSASIIVTGSNCIGETLTLSAGGNYGSYSWSTGDVSSSISVTTNGDYSLIAGAPYGCGVTDSDTVSVTFEDCTNSINETDLTLSFNVFPNPVSNELFIQFEQEEGISAMLLITDMTGKEVYTAQFQSSETNQTIDLSNLKSGTYFVKLFTLKESTTRMIVKY